MSNQNLEPHKKRLNEASFTLLETVFALGLMVSIVLEVAGVQGAAINMSEFERMSSKATWLAKGIMSRVEYEWSYRDFKEMETKYDEKPFEEDEYKEFSHSLEIKEWKLPIIKMVLSMAGGGKDNPMAAMMQQMVGQTIGDDVLKTAYVEVFWPEGNGKNSINLTYLLPNQRKLDEVWKTIPSPKSKGKKDPKKPSGGSGSESGSGSGGNSSSGSGAN